MLTKQQILQALQAWINQRPGLEFANYGDLASYRAELRSITKDRRDALELLNAVALRDSITAEDLIAAFPRAYSGRLSITENKCTACDGKRRRDTLQYGVTEMCPKCTGSGSFVMFSYTTGQYWPTEYRRAACAVLASVLWDRARADMPAPQGKVKRPNVILGETEHDSIEGMSPGEWLRRHFRRQFGRSIQSRWFN